MATTAIVVAAVMWWPRPAHAYGEATADGFPNWAERVEHEWMNRARSDPQVEMQACGNNCPEGACYGPMPPLLYDEQLNRSARFHSAEMTAQNYFAHNSICTVVSNIASIYPSPCGGAASCACVGGTDQCSPQCTTWDQRISLFGASPAGEIISSPSDPDQAFYLWLFEPFNMNVCMYVQGPPTNGHRWQILENQGPVGVGVSGVSTGDFTSGGGSIPAIASGSHYPRQSGSVGVWASWYAAAAPSVTKVNVDGTCSDMTLQRGSGTNGAYSVTLTNVASGCHRYYFYFLDANNNEVDYPTTGSLGIGDNSCDDWDSSRPAACGGGGSSSSGGGSSSGSSGGSSSGGGNSSSGGGSSSGGSGGSSSSGGGSGSGSSGGSSGGSGSGSGSSSGSGADAGGRIDAGKRADGGGIGGPDATMADAAGDDGGNADASSGDSGGCACGVVVNEEQSAWLGWLAAAGVAMAARRRARR